MTSTSYARHRFAPAIIKHAVWLYLRFTLSFRDVEDLLADRGVDVSYETVRRWVTKFGPAFAKSYVKTQQLRESEALFAAKSGALTLIPVNEGGEGFKAELVVTEKLSKIGFYPRPVDFRTVIDDRYTAQIEAGDAWREAAKAN